MNHRLKCKLKKTFRKNTENFRDLWLALIAKIQSVKGKVKNWASK